MTKRQTAKGNIATRQQGNRKGNTSNSSVSREGNKETKVKIPVKVKTALNGSIKEMEKQITVKVLKTIKDLAVICRIIDKLENRKREMIRMTLKEDDRMERKFSVNG